MRYTKLCLVMADTMCSIMGRVIFLLPLYLIQREDYNGFWCCRSDGGVLAKNSRDKII